MKKILFVSDGMQFSEGAFEFARQLNEREPILLTGVFMPQISYANLWSYTHALGGPAVVPFVDTGDAETIQKTIRHFETQCQHNGITYRVHKDYVDFALPELRKETRFADLLLLCSERFYHTVLGNDDIDYIVEALKETECPVLVVPEKGPLPTRNVITYDGSAPSVYAIKQFAYLFPEWCQLDTTVLYIHKDHEATLPYETELKELVGQHFQSVHFEQRDTDPQKQFRSWAADKEHPLLIAGAFGRSAVSQLFRKSFLRDVIAGHKLPVFIAHR
jgi:nucleotide-binding universal stress UspA family protein